MLLSADCATSLWIIECVSTPLVNKSRGEKQYNNKQLTLKIHTFGFKDRELWFNVKSQGMGKEFIISVSLRVSMTLVFLHEMSELCMGIGEKPETYSSTTIFI